MPAAAKQEAIELEDSSIRDTQLILENKQRKAIVSNESIDLQTAAAIDSSSNLKPTSGILNQNITSSSPSASSLNQQQQTQIRSSLSPTTFGQLNNTSNNNSSSINNKDNDSSDELSNSNNYNIMLDYLLKTKKQQPALLQTQHQRKAEQDSQNNQNDLNDKSNVNTLLNELNQQQQQPFNLNLAAASAAAQAVSNLFSFLPSNLQPNIYQQLPAYLSQLLQHQFTNQSQLNNSTSSSSSNLQMDTTSTVASLLQSNNNTQTANALISLPNNLDCNNSELLCNQTAASNHHSNSHQNLLNQKSSPNRSINSPQPAQINNNLQQNLLGTVLNNLNNSIATRSTGRQSPNSSLNSAHDFDLTHDLSVLSSSPRNSPNNIRQQLSQLAALTATTSSSNVHHSQLMHSPARSLLSTNSTTPSQTTSNMNAYQDLLPKPGSQDNAWESLMEVEKDNEAAKIKKLVEGCEQKITDPNQCVICQRILSCKSALQMHWRTHTGNLKCFLFFYF